jgi:hypothetical protein
MPQSIERGPAGGRLSSVRIGCNGSIDAEHVADLPLCTRVNGRHIDRRSISIFPFRTRILRRVDALAGVDGGGYCKCINRGALGLAGLAGLARNVVGKTSTTGLPHIVSSQVLVMKSAFAQKLPDGTPLFAQVLRHEFGHMAGLGHTDALSQLMDAQNLGVPTYQDGDRTGLSRLGAGPCAPDL